MKSTYTLKIAEDGLIKFLPIVNMTDRDKEIVSKYLSDKPSYKELGEAYNISGERIRQIIEKFARKAKYYYKKQQKDVN